MADFDILHSRWTADPIAIGLAFDLLIFDAMTYADSLCATANRLLRSC